MAASDRRAASVGLIVTLGITILGGAIYVVGTGVLSGMARQDRAWIPAGLIAAGIGLVLMLGGFLCARLFVAPYRRVDEALPAGATVFHVSAASWQDGEVVELSLEHCRKKQFLTQRIWQRATALVYFFPQRPTRSYAQGQKFAGRRRAPRYLYEMKLLQPVNELYARGSARAVPHNLRVEVLQRQDVADSLRGKSSTRRLAR